MLKFQTIESPENYIKIASWVFEPYLDEESFLWIYEVALIIQEVGIPDTLKFDALYVHNKQEFIAQKGVLLMLLYFGLTILDGEDDTSILQRQQLNEAINLLEELSFDGVPTKDGVVCHIPLNLEDKFQIVYR